MVFPLPDCPLFSRSMPCRGIAYQPRVPTLGIHPKKQLRVLKERRIGRGASDLGSALPSGLRSLRMEEKLKLGKLKAEIRRTENEKPAISAFRFLLSAFLFSLSAFCFHLFCPDSPYAVFL